MRGNESEKNLQDKIRKSLDEEAENLDRTTVRDLRSMRMEALETLESKGGFARIPRWLTVGGVASAVVLVAAISMVFFSSQKTLPVKNPEDFELLSAKEQQELYTDLEFYRWLAEQENEG
jgi:hypothetical protein